MDEHYVDQVRLLLRVLPMQACFVQVWGSHRDTGVFELRIHHGSGYRVYYGRDGDEIVILLAGGAKKRQQRDIDGAVGNWNAYKREKRNANQGS